MGNDIDQPVFAVSTDGGITFQNVLSLSTDFPAPAPGYPLYDYPQYCFGGDPQEGTYGLYFVVDYFDPYYDVMPIVGFIPITGLGQFGTSQVSQPLTGLSFINDVANITASADGRVWTQGLYGFGEFNLFGSPAGILFKSPSTPLNSDTLALNWTGLWQTIISNFASWIYVLDFPGQDSQPVQGYNPISPQSIIYDDSRQALYAAYSAPFPDRSQNMRLYFIISRDNGQTWSSPIDISTTDFANRGFQSMALNQKKDPVSGKFVSGGLVFGWYDGRNDPTFKSVEYYAATISAKKLDKLVNAIPLSDPIYSICSAADPNYPLCVADRNCALADAGKTNKNINHLKKRFARRQHII